MSLKASVLLYLLLCAQVADWASTVWIMSLGGYEANPIMAPLFAISPWLPLVPKMGAVAFCALLWVPARRLEEIQAPVLWCFVLAVAVSMPPVVWNMIQLAKAGLL